MFSDIINDSNDLVWNALEFATYQHRLQRRKGYEHLPYINHPIAVAGILKRFGETEAELIAAALLHDVLEDTNSTPREIENRFGAHIKEIVLEVTDDMSLPSAERKALQVIHASTLSDKAKKIKIADKTANTLDIFRFPLSWSPSKKKHYITWAGEVVKECCGVNKALEEYFFTVAEECMKKLVQEN